jgi:uncharacterized surface protein with fasciclin (FAS1) repeats
VTYRYLAVVIVTGRMRCTVDLRDRKTGRRKERVNRNVIISGSHGTYNIISTKNATSDIQFLPLFNRFTTSLLPWIEKGSVFTSDINTHRLSIIFEDQFVESSCLKKTEHFNNLRFAAPLRRLYETSTMNFRTAISCLVAASAMTSSLGGVDDCESVAEIVCGGSTKSLCDAIDYTSFGQTLDDGEITFFAPTDEAVSKLVEALGFGIVEEIDEEKLKNILFYHAVLGKTYDKDKLKERCGKKMTMANGLKTKTICDDGDIFQSGASNDPEDRPLIVEFDIKACNGIVHLVNEVILPPCESIKKIVCGADGFGLLCEALKRTNLDDVLAGSGSFTVFAPTDDAFHKLLGDNALTALEKLDDVVLSDLLLYHVVDDDVLSSGHLECNKRYVMANDEKSRT